MKVEFCLHVEKYNPKEDFAPAFGESICLHRVIDMSNPPCVGGYVGLPKQWWALVKQVDWVMRDSKKWEVDVRCEPDVPRLDYQEGHKYLERVVQRLQSGWKLSGAQSEEAFQRLVEWTQKEAAHLKRETEEVTARIAQVKGVEKLMARDVRLTDDKAD